MNKNRPTPGHIIMKPQKTDDEEEVIKSSGGRVYSVGRRSEWYRMCLQQHWKLEGNGVRLQNFNGKLFPTKILLKLQIICKSRIKPLSYMYILKISLPAPFLTQEYKKIKQEGKYYGIDEAGDTHKGV